MAPPSGPRIGRPDRLTALREGRYARPFRRDIFRAADRAALEMLLTREAGAPAPAAPAPASTTPFALGVQGGRPEKNGGATPVSRAQAARVREAAERLADELRPLPGALSELTIRINCHCARTGRDAELAHAVDVVRAATVDLWRASVELAEAAKGET